MHGHQLKEKQSNKIINYLLPSFSAFLPQIPITHSLPIPHPQPPNQSQPRTRHFINRAHSTCFNITEVTILSLRCFTITSPRAWAFFSRHCFAVKTRRRERSPGGARFSLSRSPTQAILIAVCVVSSRGEALSGWHLANLARFLDTGANNRFGGAANQWGSWGLLCFYNRVSFRLLALQKVTVFNAPPMISQ